MRSMYQIDRRGGVQKSCAGKLPPPMRESKNLSNVVFSQLKIIKTLILTIFTAMAAALGPPTWLSRHRLFPKTLKLYFFCRTFNVKFKDFISLWLGHILFRCMICTKLIGGRGSKNVLNLFISSKVLR